MSLEIRTLSEDLLKSKSDALMQTSCHNCVKDQMKTYLYFCISFCSFFSTLTGMSETESVRISSALKKELKTLAKAMRPKTAIQYLIEDAVEQYLDRISEEGGPAYRAEPAKKTSGKKKSKS